MKKRFLTLLLILVVTVGALSVVGAAETTVETLTAYAETKVITEDMTLDTAGYSIGTLTVNPGVTLTLQGTSSGTIGTIDGGGIVILSDGVMTFEGGHQLTLKTEGISLRNNDLNNTGVGLYYTCSFSGNTTVKSKLSAYGVAMYLSSTENLFAENTYTCNEDLSGWKTTGAFNANGVLLKNIMKADKAYSLNKVNGVRNIYNVPYVQLLNGTRITGAPASRTVKSVVAGIVQRDFWDASVSYTQKTNMVNMYNTFSGVMKNWTLGALRPYVENGTYNVYTPSDMQLMADNPNASYAIKADIDMTGIVIDGLENFAGSITGNGKTISNLTINGVGLVDTVASGKSITDLHLRDVEVIVPSNSNAKYVGTLAAVNNGSITGVTVTGSVKDTRTGAEDAKIYVGALVGDNNSTVTPGTTVSVNDAWVEDAEGNSVLLQTVAGSELVDVEEEDFLVENLCADVGLLTEESEYVVTGLVGEGTVTDAASVYWRDSSYATKYEDAELQRRRQVVTDYVYELGTIKWTPATTIKYYNDQKNASSMTPGTTGYQIHNYTYEAGTTYVGVPYTHCSSSLEQAQFYMTQNADGVYVLGEEITTLSGGAYGNAGESTWYNGDIGWGKYIGTDCSSSMTVAWHQVSPILLSNKTNGGVCLYYTANTSTSNFNQWYYGFKQVGDYEVDDTWTSAPESKWTTAKDSDGNTRTDYKLGTNDIHDNIGDTAVYEAYAQAQQGDIMNGYVKDWENDKSVLGHARLVVRDPVVIRNGENEIDPAKSYFITHEQGSGFSDRTANSSWKIHCKYTFEEMIGGPYLPITMNAFHDTTISSYGEVTKNGGKVDGNDPMQWVMNSGFRIQSATLIIKDAKGNVKYEKTAFQGTSNSQYRRRCIPGYVTLRVDDLFSDCCDNLTEGETYYATFSGTTFTSDTDKALLDGYEFTYTPAA